MGEVRVSLKLTNALDEELHRSQQLPESQIRCYEALAVVDTGAVPMIVPQFVADRLGLSVRGHRVVEYADGRKESVDLTSALVVEIAGRDTIEEAVILGDEILIGQTVLEKLDLLVDCANRILTSNPAHPDQPVIKVK